MYDHWQSLKDSILINAWLKAYIWEGESILHVDCKDCNFHAMNNIYISIF